MNMKHKYRGLTTDEITGLINSGCSAGDWTDVMVPTEGFDPSFLHRVHFGGQVYLGRNGTPCAPVSGYQRHSGIYNASIYNCTIGDGVYISNIGRYISGYDIGDCAVIENVGELSADKGAVFGIGVKASVINEAGGREIPLSTNLTAQIAYITAMYRHRPDAIRRIEEIISSEAAEAAEKRAVVGKGSVIVNCTSINNVNIGDSATISGAVSLANGTVCSSPQHPSYIGHNVSAKDFIISYRAIVDNGAILRRCFIGEGVLIDNGFSAENSVFFANSHCSHGEACAVFGGPYTVTHHRSTLLIAGYFSFFNAGSGANQSNHMYKSGPVHQGVHLRGCKFASDAYIMLPARTGAFSTVKGRHYAHHDTEDMPFSYLIEELGESYLYPGINLRSYGLARDIKKWPDRDKRNGLTSDIINFEMMSPYIGNRLLRGISQGEELLSKRPTAEVQLWKRLKIRTSQLKKGLQLYAQALHIYIGSVLEGIDTEGLQIAEPYIEWVDIAGMLAPKARIDELLGRIEDGRISTLPELRAELEKINSFYRRDTEAWAAYALSILLGKEQSELTSEDFENIIEQGSKDREMFETFIKNDAGRDSAPLMAVGYGIDGERDRDFRSVRGN